MVEDAASNQPLVIVSTAIITAVTTIIVAKISNSTNKKQRIKKVRDFTGYEAYIDYLKNELKNTKTEFSDKLTVLEDRVKDLQKELLDEKNKNRKYRQKILEFGKKYNEDIGFVLE